MRLVLSNLFRRSPLEGTIKHADKVSQCGPIFAEAVKAYFAGDRDKFELLKEDIREIENEADKMKRNIRAHLPASILLPFDKSVFFNFLREADKVVDGIKNCLYWMSYYQLDLPEEIQKDYILLAKQVNDYVGFLPEMTRRAHTYFINRMEQDRDAVKEVIREIRFRERESDDLEKTMLIRLCALDEMPSKTFFIMVRLVETTGDIADHLENSADMVRVMIAR